jgi:hypothetical protein
MSLEIKGISLPPDLQTSRQAYLIPLEQKNGGMSGRAM